MIKPEKKVCITRAERKTKEFIEARFWSKADVRGEDECWEWKAGKLPGGYGMFQMEGKYHGAHRVAWALDKDRSIPEGLVVMHSCDNRPCVNPRHLSLGTTLDNIADMHKKGRAMPPRGEEHWSRARPDRLARGDNHGSRTHPGRIARGAKQGLAKLTDEKVMEIRERYTQGGVFYRQLAQEFGVSQSLIGLVIQRKKWIHVA